MHIKNLFLILFVFAFCLSPRANADKYTIMNILDKMATEGKKSHSDLEYLHNTLHSSNDNISELLIMQLNAGRISEKQKAVYIWALGLTNDERANDTIIGIYNEEKDKKSLVADNCLGAMVNINAPGTGDFIYDILTKTNDPKRRFNIMLLLARLQYEKALPDFTETLDNEQWQSMFLFGKMGEKSVSVLIGKLNDPNPKIRGNAAFLLGQFIMSETAVNPLMEQYKKEPDSTVKKIIISGLDRIVTDLKEQESIFNDLLKTEKDPTVRNFLQGALTIIPLIKQKAMEAAKLEAKGNHMMFEAEYTKLFNSCGRKGNFDILATYGTKEDDEKLLKLRKRILEVETDEALYRAASLNQAIIFFRVKEKLKDERK